MNVAAEVEQFLVGEIAPGLGPVEPDSDLLADAVLDSLGIVRMITFLEERYAIKVDDDDLAPENFRTVESIVAFVDQKRT